MSSQTETWQQRPRHAAARYVIAVLLAGWAAVALGGTALLWKYASAPGTVAAAPQRWPHHTAVARQPGRATLVMFVHPRCPCTRASVAELAWLMTRFSDRVTATVVVGAFDDGEALRAAREIPGLHFVALGAAEAAAFGASTSGQTLLYDASGELVFAGGITGARGHEGDNPGRARVVAVLDGVAPDRRDSPVFGCALGAAGTGDMRQGSDL